MVTLLLASGLDLVRDLKSVYRSQLAQPRYMVKQRTSFKHDNWEIVLCVGLHQIHSCKFIDIGPCIHLLTCKLYSAVWYSVKSTV